MLLFGYLQVVVVPWWGWHCACTNHPFLGAFLKDSKSSLRSQEKDGVVWTPSKMIHRFGKAGGKSCAEERKSESRRDWLTPGDSNLDEPCCFFDVTVVIG